MKKNFFATIMACIILFSSCGNRANPESQIVEANIIAMQASLIVDDVLNSIDVVGTGMIAGNEYVQVFDVKVKDGIWTCNAADLNNFRYNDRVEEQGFHIYKWGNAGKADSNTKKGELSGAESLICYELCKKFPDMKNAAFKFSLQSNKCKSSAYIEDASSITYGVDCPDTYDDGSFIEPFNWNGKISGVNSRGQVVGTYPETKLAFTKG